MTDNLDPSTKQRWLSELSERNLNDRMSKNKSKSCSGNLSNKSGVNSLHVNKDKDSMIVNGTKQNSACKLTNELEIKSTNLINQQSIPFTDGLLITTNNMSDGQSSMHLRNELMDHADYFKIDRQDKQDQTFKWPGIEAVTRSYQEFTRGKYWRKLILNYSRSF